MSFYFILNFKSSLSIKEDFFHACTNMSYCAVYNGRSGVYCWLLTPIIIGYAECPQFSVLMRRTRFGTLMEQRLSELTNKIVAIKTSD